MAFSTTNATLLTTGLVTAGRWSEGKGLDLSIVVAAGALALGLAVLTEVSPPLGQRFALLILLGVFLRYAVPIFRKTGLAR